MLLIKNGEFGELLADNQVASNTVTSVFLPKKILMDEFIRQMEVKGCTLYLGKGKLKARNMFQIANMGEMNEDMCFDLLKVIAETINELTT